MPRLFGHNIIFVIAAAVVIYLIGFVWYGVLFSGAMEEAGVAATQTSPLRMWGIGMAIPLLYAIGLALIAGRTSSFGLTAYVKLALICAVCFTIATELADFAYDARYTAKLTLVDISHQLLIFAAAGAILSFGRSAEVA